MASCSGYGSMPTWVLYIIGVAVFSCLKIIPNEFIAHWYERNLWAKSGTFMTGRIRGTDAWIRPAGQQKTTRGSCSPDPRVTRFLRVMT